MFDVWMHLLKGAGLRFMAPVPNETCRQQFEARGGKPGVDARSLRFCGRMPIAKHLARQRLADLFSDALPCNAHTTASDALWAGLPVLTCIGETLPGASQAVC